MLSNYYKNCTLCPRNCGVDRNLTVGYCGEGDVLKAARAGLHFYEEPYISGNEGSGTVFFTGCSLKCIYCQNYEISESNQLQQFRQKQILQNPQQLFFVPDKNDNKQAIVRKAENTCRKTKGFEITVERLAEIFLEQQARGANNINLVTGTHFTPSIAEAIKLSRGNGLTIPTLWNSSGYEKTETLKLLEGLIDIWLPDFKTLSPELGKKYMNAPDYPDVVKDAIDFMVCENKKSINNTSKKSETIFDRGLMKKGVNVRHLVMPGSTKDSMAVIEYLYKKYGDDIYISIMSQYTPLRELPYKELNRKLTKREYEKVVNFAIDLGVSNGMIQEGNVAESSFIPNFDGEGIKRSGN